MTAAAILVSIRPCVKCGASERYSTGVCKPCQKAASKSWHGRNIAKSNAKDLTWYANNTSQANANSTAWGKANPEKLKAYRGTPAAKAAASASARAWQNANPEKFKALGDAYRAANRYDLRIYGQNARAKELGVTGQLSDGLIDRRLIEQQGTCPCCNETLGEDFQMDHIVSLYNGGLNVDDNVHLLKTHCNLTKGTKNFDVFMQTKASFV